MRGQTGSRDAWSERESNNVPGMLPEEVLTSESEHESDSDHQFIPGQ